MKIINLPPYAPTLIESTRSIGYSLKAAIADIIDNSIAAKATKINLYFFPTDGEYIAILDNGTGMSETELNSAMQYGSRSPEDTRDPKDLGRFGLGLKTASLSQCRTLSVITKKNNRIFGRCWDIDYVIKNGDWSLIALDESDMASLPEFDKLKSLKSGTLVIWQNLDRMKLGEVDFQKSMAVQMDEVRSHLSLVFHRYLTGEPGLKKISISMNDLPVEPFDPFMTKKSTMPMDCETLIIRGQKIAVQPYLLPHPSKLNASELKALGGKDGLRKGQGFYIYRNKRLLVWGTWFRMMRQGDLSKLIRIKVDIPNTLDDLWTLDIKKSSANPPEEVKNNLKSIIESLSVCSQKTWKFRGKKETTGENIHVWNRLKTRTGGYLYEINRDYPLIKQMIEENPSQEKQLESILRTIENNLPLNALYVDLSNDNKIENEDFLQKNKIMDSLKSILAEFDKTTQEDLINNLLYSEPFCNYSTEIRQAFDRGELL